MTDTNTLAPCPFCGGDAEQRFNDFYGDKSMAACKCCGATAYAPKWNCRAPVPASQAVAAPVGILPVASKSHGAWDGIEDVLELPDGTDIYSAAQVQAMLAHGLAPGWQAVPVEPTEEIERAMAAQFCGTVDEVRRAWAEGIAAAPQPPAQAQDAEIAAYAVGDAKVERMSQPCGGFKWAVRIRGDVLSKQGFLEYEPQPSSRDDEFMARCRFDSAQEAIDAAIAAQQGSAA